MRAVIVEEPGGPESLVVADLPDPAPGPGEVAVTVAAAGVNRADLLQRQGHYPPPPGITDVLGLECSGIVESVGEGVTDHAPGDEVCVLLSGGGYAERVVAPAGQVVRVPTGTTLIEAAAIPETYATVWSNVFMLASLSEGEKLLVHGGASGIGTTAIQLAKAFGATVVTTVGSEDKARTVRELGADVVVNYREDDFVEACQDLGGVDVVLDIIGGRYLAQNVASLARGGRIVVIGMQGGRKGELNLGALLAKQGTIAATSLRFRPAQEKAEIMADLVEHVWPLIEQGRLGPIVHETVPLARVADAHRILEESSHIGKVVLDVGV
ncbi:zinc-binding dehydrogenase [Aeromicrobium sp. 636]|uniref:NAD(P)H-quinone oxidoreductase n=1 Tax=Aeromicrobium senzhongii TaxID=2663859 RepID=A0A8I0EVR0_9ACTN|nr:MULTISPECIES: NAD(P)H-quinone oxidoreductase [Aeromicrobium]MBC9227115.1 NAD(P)H-quinone oxidoreductase [Aeromicrobium senzhongii]MCQ3999215.1 zinc-binding dehydrogenase [Aeromicrobium sp. 636]MTB88478.1 zinc-binding dehydrogenase [Aeromicrobium senzhongii]QNL94560.1 NAD(P)H-quinone oxidoreductase [Aeromicrobium senzhongii]